MASKYPEINEQSSQHIHLPADYIRFTEPARRVMEPEFGRTYPQPRPFPPSHAHLTHETALREIEKQWIRKEAIMAEIVRRRVLEAEVRQVVRRRVLEAEVRQELMMERELASRTVIPTGFSMSSSVMGFEPSIRLPALVTGVESRSLEKRIVPYLAEKEMLGRNGHQSGGFESFPFQRRSNDLVISDARPAASEGAKEKNKIWLAEPDEDVAALKRRAPTPPARLDSSKSPSKDVGIISSKKAKAELYCSVCHISATSEQALYEHLKGRKHKAKEATVRARRARKNYSMGLFLKNATKSIEVPVTADSSSTSEIPQPQTDPEKDQSVFLEARKKEESTKNRFKFWCEMCLVGSNSKKDLNAHTRGKKHARCLEVGRQIVSDDREKTAVPVNHEGVIVDGHGKNVTSVDIVDANKAGKAVVCAEPADRSWPTQM